MRKGYDFHNKEDSSISCYKMTANGTHDNKVDPAYTRSSIDGYDNPGYLPDGDGSTIEQIDKGENERSNMVGIFQMVSQRETDPQLAPGDCIMCIQSLINPLQIGEIQL